MDWQLLETWWPLFLAAGGAGVFVFVRMLTLYAEREILLHDKAREATELFLAEYRRRADQSARRDAIRRAREAQGE